VTLSRTPPPFSHRKGERRRYRKNRKKISPGKETFLLLKERKTRRKIRTNPDPI
jgi:hypothetical protein